MAAPTKCNWSAQPHSFAAREFGCPLDHCPCGYHIDDPNLKDHVCECSEHGCSLPLGHDGVCRDEWGIELEPACGCYETGDAESGPTGMVECELHALQTEFDLIRLELQTAVNLLRPYSGCDSRIHDANCLCRQREAFVAKHNDGYKNGGKL